jgi:hypothetical protein
VRERRAGPGSDPVAGVAVDPSSAGVLVATAQPSSSGRRVDVEITLGSLGTVPARGTVAREVGGPREGAWLAGIAFHHVLLADRRRLARFLAERRRDATGATVSGARWSPVGRVRPQPVLRNPAAIPLMVRSSGYS